MRAVVAHKVEPNSPVATHILISAFNVFFNLTVGGDPRRSPAAICVAAVLWFAATPPLRAEVAHGTAAVAIWGPDRVVLAADSKITHLGKAPAPDTTDCKIRRSGRFYFSMSGYYGRPESSFDAWRLVAEAGRNAKTVADAARASEVATLPQLQLNLTRARAEDPAAFAAAFREVYLAVFFAGIDSGVPNLVGWELLTTGRTIHDAYPGARIARQGDMAYNAFGEHGAIDAAYPNGSSMMRLLRDPVVAARTMIQVEIDRTPTKVGPPVSILEITKQGHRWIQEGRCQNQQ